MKLKALLLAVAVAGFTASFALADGGHHGRHHEHAATATTATTATTTTMTTTAANACAEVGLRGTLGTVTPTSFTLVVARQETGDDEDDDDDNANAAPAVPNLVGQTVTVAVGPNTRVSFSAIGALRGPATGDVAKVDALACGTPMTLTARSVKAAPATTTSSNGHESKSHR
jgi:hypothetical protein